MGVGRQTSFRISRDLRFFSLTVAMQLSRTGGGKGKQAIECRAQRLNTSRALSTQGLCLVCVYVLVSQKTAGCWQSSRVITFILTTLCRRNCAHYDYEKTESAGSVVRPLQGRSRAQEGEATPLGHSPTSGQGLPAQTCSSSKVQ